MHVCAHGLHVRCVHVCGVCLCVCGVHLCVGIYVCSVCECCAHTRHGRGMCSTSWAQTQEGPRGPGRACGCRAGRPLGAPTEPKQASQWPTSVRVPARAACPFCCSESERLGAPGAASAPAFSFLPVEGGHFPARCPLAGKRSGSRAPGAEARSSECQTACSAPAPAGHFTKEGCNCVFSPSHLTICSGAAAPPHGPAQAATPACTGSHTRPSRGTWWVHGG